MSYCEHCGSESVEEDMKGQFPPDVIVIRCKRCGKRKFITGEDVLELKRILGIFDEKRRIEYY